MLGRYPNVKQNVVIVREDEPDNKLLVAYLISENGDDISPGKLREFLAITLPQYMLPSLVVQMDEFPLTPNGKINRRALPKPEMEKLETGQEYVAPRNATEEQLAGIWAELLKVPRVGVNDNFFELGGHSLLAAQFVTRLKKMFHQQVSLVTVFSMPTIAGLARVLQDEHSESLTSSPANGNKPFFWAHGTDFANLSAYLSNGQSIVCLMPSGIDGESPILDNMGSIVSFYIEQMKSIQPKGPYMLGGYCGGGEVAFAIARQLRAQGEEVALLALVDLVLLEELAMSFTEALKFRLKNGQIIRAIVEKMRDYRKKITELITEGQQARLVNRIVSTQDRVFENYQFRSYPGRVVLFECQEASERKTEDWYQSWSDIAQQGYTLHIIPGNHSSMMRKPSVQILGEILADEIKKASEGESVDR